MFVPTVLSLWLVVGAMSMWQVYRIREIRTSLVYDQMKFLTERLIDLNSNKEDMTPYITFVNSFYNSEDDYDDVTIMSYDKTTGKFTAIIGNEIYVPEGSTKTVTGKFESNYIEDKSNKKYPFLYYTIDVPDSNKTVITLLPFTKKVTKVIAPVTVRFWIIMIAVSLFATFVAYVSTGYVVSNINFLRIFTRRAAKRENFDVTSVKDLPNDELGDITRDIVDIYGQLTDEIARSEQEHKVALTAIEEKARIKRKLTANINHEIKTPIGIIKGYVDTILGDPLMPEDVKHKFLVKIQQNVDRLTELIADIAVITKYENGEKLVAISEIDFHDLVYTFAEELKMADMGKNKLPFTFDVPLRCMISGNEPLVRGVLSNLVRNACLYSQGTMCHLQFEKQDDEFYYFSFYDDGVGVPPESLPRLFERFYRVNEGRERNDGGTGLGLPIVKVTIESFGGTIDVENRTPSGLIFRFTLAKFKGTPPQGNATKKV